MPLEATKDIHQRFFLLAGLVRHEFWLHQQRPEDFGFRADPDTLTLHAAKQQDPGEQCTVKLTEEMLEGDLHALARLFYRRVCGGMGTAVHGHPKEKWGKG